MNCVLISRRQVALSTALLASLTGGLEVHGQLTISALNTPQTIDFDSTISGVSNGAWNGAGFQSSPTAGQLDSDAWAVTGWSNGALAFGGTQITASTDYTRGFANNVAVSTGGMYAFSGGNITTGVALGIQPAGADFAPGTLTLKISNGTGTTLTSLAIGYRLYVRNDTARSSSFNFSYSGDDSSYTPVGALDYTSTAAADGLGFVANDKSTTLTGLSIGDGASFYLRWSSADVGGTGIQRDEFALDNISVTAVPEPSVWALAFGLGLGTFAFLRARRLREA